MGMGTGKAKGTGKGTCKGKGQGKGKGKVRGREKWGRQIGSSGGQDFWNWLLRITWLTQLRWRLDELR